MILESICERNGKVFITITNNNKKQVIINNTGSCGGCNQVPFYMQKITQKNKLVFANKKFLT